MVYTQDQIINLATQSYVTPQMVVDQMGGTAVLGDEWSMALDNLKYAYNQSPTFYREVVADTYGWNGQTVTASEALIPKPVMAQDGTTVLGTTAEKYPAVTTPVGNVRAGALAGRISMGTLIAGTAIGAGIGLKEVASHPKFWNDLSNAVFNDIKNPETWIEKPLAETETAEIIWRCMSDGSIQSYCDKRSIDAVIRNMYSFGAFNVSGSISPDVTTIGEQYITVEPIDVGYIQQAGRAQGVSSIYYQSLLDYALLTYPATTTIGVRVYPKSIYDIYEVDIYCYDLTSGMYQVSQLPDGLGVAFSGHNFGMCTCNFDANTGAVVGDFRHSDGVTQGGLLFGLVELGGTSYVTTNFGTSFIPANPNVIYNGTDQLPPSDPDNFWQTFALWLANSFTTNPYNPATNAYEPVTYVPITAPDINWKQDPITGDQTNIWKGLYEFVEPFTTPTTTPVNNPSPWIFESIGDYVIPKIDIPTSTPWDNNPKFPTPTPSPIGSSPTIAVPTSGVSSGSKLFSVYNPSQSNIDSLGAYLWDVNILDQINKFFSNNPLDAIISLHMVYCTPTTGSSKNIYLGSLNSGVSAPVVTSQYETIACGDVDVPELYGNALDYDGVSIQAFLPFIGWRSLRVKDTMGKRVRITYKIDVYTGTCLALISVISAGSDQLLYSFEGNCSVQIPLTASDRTRLISGLVMAGVSAYTGNPAGVVGGIASIKQDVDRSGSFSGNAGAMGVKKPYLVISRALSAQASNYNSLYGYPLHKSGLLQNFRGYTRVQSVRVDIPKATDYEKRLISDRLKNGVIL